MEKVLYDEIRESEAEHCWFQARREILVQIINTFVRKGVAGLDVGCGTGFILEKLQHDYDAHGSGRGRRQLLPRARLDLPVWRFTARNCRNQKT